MASEYEGLKRDSYGEGVKMVDVMGGASRIEKQVSEHGFVALVDIMPRLVPEGQTADSAIVQAARVSYGAGTKRVNEDKGLIRYLMRHRHTTPSEMIELKFHASMPIFVARQWIRHRTANVNEYSGRYSEMPDKFFRPEQGDIRLQSGTNKQGGEEPVDLATAQQYLDYLDRAERLHEDYRGLVERGVSREQARIGLPQTNITEWYWKIDLHNLMHFLSLRADPHAQKEIRDYAEGIMEILNPIVPVAMEAFRDYRLNSTSLSALDIEGVRRIVGGEDPEEVAKAIFDNKRERREFLEKQKVFFD